MAGGRQRRRDGRARPGVGAALVVAILIVVYGGYGRHWSWIGISGRTATLWDWLHLLLLPLAVVLLPLALSRRTRVDHVSKVVASVVGVAFAVIVIAGYTVPWAWTGFTGNSLWDWLNLIALPLTIALVPLALELRSAWGRRHTLLALGGGAVFAALVLGGYLASWRWTGFTGNTLWDWLHLLLLPLLVPTVVVPALKPAAMARLEFVEEPDPAADPAPGLPSLREPERSAPASVASAPETPAQLTDS